MFRASLILLWVSLVAISSSGCATHDGSPDSPSAIAKRAETPGGAPDWVEQNGTAAAFPPDRYLTGFALAKGQEDALESAKQQAASDLARQISVQIEASVVDVTREENGAVDSHLTSQIRATSDIRLEGIRFETYRTRRQTFALAVMDRLAAARSRRAARDRALKMTEECLGSAAREEDSGRATAALASYRSCRKPLGEAIEHEAIAAALLRGRLLEGEAGDLLARHTARLEERVRSIPHEEAQSIARAAEGLAAQLASGGIGRGQQIQVAPFLYQSRDVSSPFGRELGIALESAIGRVSPRIDSGASAVVIRGTYHEADGGFYLRVNAKAAGTGTLIASAELLVAAAAIPADLATRPANFERFTADADKLAGGEVVSGDLRVELRTNKGTRGLVYDEGEELSLFVRVNQPAWVRLIYVLTSGDHVPIDQAWYLDETKVNQLVEYPDAFEVVAPFGVEMLHVMAYTERPNDLVTRSVTIDGQSYSVVSEGADQVVRQRGIARKRKRQVAEQTLTVTTMKKLR